MFVRLGAVVTLHRTGLSIKNVAFIYIMYFYGVYGSKNKCIDLLENNTAQDGLNKHSHANITRLSSGVS